MNITDFSKHIFWSYKDKADIPPERIIKLVISHGEISDFITLSKRIPHHKIVEVLKNWKEKERYKKHIHFMNKVILRNDITV